MERRRVIDVTVSWPLVAFSWEGLFVTDLVDEQKRWFEWASQPTS